MLFEKTNDYLLDFLKSRHGEPIEIVVPLPYFKLKKSDWKFIKSRNKIVSTRTFSMNHYSSLNSFKINECKKAMDAIYGRAIRSSIPKLITGKYMIHYQLFFDKHSSGRDSMNYGAPLDKFFCDSLQNAKRVMEDNTKFVTNHTFSYQGKHEKDHAIAYFFPL